MRSCLSKEGLGKHLSGGFSARRKERGLTLCPAMMLHASAPIDDRSLQGSQHYGFCGSIDLTEMAAVVFYSCEKNFHTSSLDITSCVSLSVSVLLLTAQQYLSHLSGKHVVL